MKDLSYTDKSNIIDSANERELILVNGPKVYKAKLAGKKCDYPMAYNVTETEQTIECEISWQLAIRLSKGETNTILL